MRRSTREADDPNVPEWPEARQCKRCGRDVWCVFGEDGKGVVVDATPMDTQVMVDNGERVRLRARASYRFDEARRECGWRLLDPQRVSRCVAVGVVRGDWDDDSYVREREVSDWEWCARRVHLTPENDEPLYSEHRLTCPATTAKYLDAMFEEFADLDEEDEPRVPKRVAGALRVKKLVERRKELVLGWPMFATLPKLRDAVTTKNGQIGLWWRPELERKRGFKAAPRQEVVQPQLSLFRGGDGEQAK